jgi:hypothetical protein
LQAGRRTTAAIRNTSRSSHGLRRATIASSSAIRLVPFHPGHHIGGIDLLRARVERNGGFATVVDFLAQIDTAFLATATPTASRTSSTAARGRCNRTRLRG